MDEAQAFGHSQVVEYLQNFELSHNNSQVDNVKDAAGNNETETVNNPNSDKTSPIS